jgi:hypothetical protein
VRKGRVNGQGEGRRIWPMYFVYWNENDTIKPVEIVLRGKRDERE